MSPKPNGILRKDQTAEETYSRCEQYASVLLHDLETPLASMKSVVRLLESGAYDPTNERHIRLVKSVGIALNRAETMLADFMEASRWSDSGLQAGEEEFDLVDCIEEAAEFSSVAAAENNIEISIDTAPTRCRVRSDKNLISRITDNLIYNAIRHTPSNGVIRLSIIDDPKTAIVTVTDDGLGLGDIDPEDLFDKYRQMELRIQRKHRGVGLGLYFCRLATDAVGGRIWADNSPDGGAVFSFTVPKREVQR